MQIKTGFYLPLALVVTCAMGLHFVGQNAQPVVTEHYIIQDGDAGAVVAAIEAMGGEITHQLDIIDAVAVRLSAHQRDQLTRTFPSARVHLNAVTETAGRKTKSPVATTEATTPTSTTEVAGDAYSQYPSLVEADRLHAEGVTGSGVTVAVVDSGIYTGPGLSSDTSGNSRVIAGYDATTDVTVTDYSKRHGYRGLNGFDNDDNGHGSHVASAGFNSKLSAAGKFNGIAPDVSLISIKVFDTNGRGTYADVIRGVEWAVHNKDKFGIRVLNMSLSATPQSHYWEDPLNQAVMVAWEAGIVVVASAGNTGPDAQTIGVPGNVPYIITVGAMTDNSTPADPSDDRLASFSAAGPTFEGFVKPDVVAPGGHIMAAMKSDSAIALQHPEFHDGASFFSMSGTSQATALVSGIAALVLQAEPALTPDQVKCKIMAGARPALDENGELAYSLFQQGAGLTNAYDSVYGSTYDCANNGLDVRADIDDEKHFGGRANQLDDGTYYVMGMEGYLWSDGRLSGSGYLWSNGYLWSDGYLWSSGYLWTNSVQADGYLWRNSYAESDGYLWRNGYLWSSGYLWSNSLTETMSVNSWVRQE